MDDYFVVIYDSASKEPKVTTIEHFRNADAVWPWLKAHKDEKIVIFKAQCVIDWS